ncbi:DUF2909 family protein [Ferrimonas pelagia]|uniref:DUF2909 family protein n=1 Tax=Ferrimonas pelagia TaxID=1177826 RepID=A0ABP9F5U3_9GAMM
MIILIKTVIVLLLLYILFNLIWAGISMIRHGNSTEQRSMTHYLGRRVGLSALILLLLIVALLSGLMPVNPRPY